MAPKLKKHVIALIIAFLCMILLIPATFLITGGLPPRDTSSTVRMIMRFLLIGETALCCFIFITIGKLGNLIISLPSEDTNASSENLHKSSRQDRAYKRIGIVILSLSIAVSILLQGIGLVCDYRHLILRIPIFKTLFFIFFFCSALFIPVNILLNKLYLRSYQKRNVEEILFRLFRQREYARTESLRMLTLLKRIRCITTAITVILLIPSVYIALFSTALFKRFIAVPILFYSVFLFFNVFSRVPYKVPEETIDEDVSYVSERDYSKLYSLARRAASTVNISGEVKISLEPNFNASIGKIGNIYVLHLGVVMLKCMNESELYNMLLHEFAHMAPTNSRALMEYRYYNWLTFTKPKTYLSSISSVHFSFIDTYYCVQFNIYKYIAAVLKEQYADDAIIKYGDPKSGASALLKLNYYSLFLWERSSYENPLPPMFAAEEPKTDILRTEARLFLEAAESRHEEWNRLTAIEILPRSATHPTTKMRLKRLGINSYSIDIPNESSEQYIMEQEKALTYSDRMISENIVVAYDELRRIEYIEPKEIVDTWISLGRPVVSEEYADVVNSLRKLKMTSEALTLCDRSINELPKAASAYALFVKGCYYLHKYDSEGIGYLYRAMICNNSYIDDSLDNIGRFCCLTGRQDELDAYREMAMALAQKQIDEYGEITVLNKKDILSPEYKLTQTLRDNIKNYIETIDNGKIEKVFLFRKTISDSFFTSVFVVKFKESVPQNIQRDTIHKLSYYLETCDEWQFSLFNYSKVSKVKFENIKNSLFYIGK